MASLPGKQPEPPAPEAASPTPGIPEPPRYLGPNGRAVWDRAWERGRSWVVETEVELLLLTCEQIDERQILRRRVLEANDWRERAGLRSLDRLIRENLALLGASAGGETLSLGSSEGESPVASIAARRAARIARAADTADAGRRSQPRRRARGD